MQKRMKETSYVVFLSSQDFFPYRYTTQSTLTFAERVVLQPCQHLHLQNALLSYNPVNTYICRTRCYHTTQSTLTSAERVVIIQPSQHLHLQNALLSYNPVNTYIYRTRCYQATQSTLTSAKCNTVNTYICRTHCYHTTQSTLTSAERVVIILLSSYIC